MTASQKPKTPSMIMHVRPGTPKEDVDLFCKRASRVALSQIVDSVAVREQLKATGDVRRTQFTVDITFFPKEEYQSAYDVDPLEILGTFATKFPLLLKREMQLEMKRLDTNLRSQIADLGKGKKADNGGEGDGEGEDDGEADLSKKRRDDDERSEAGDGGADEEKRSRQRKQQSTYESDDSSDKDDADAENEAAIDAAYASDEEVDGLKDTKSRKAQSASFRTEVKDVSELFQGNLHYATFFDFDESQCNFQLEVNLDSHCCVCQTLDMSQFSPDMPKLLFVGIVERTCRTTVIREIPGISECFQVKQDAKGGGEPAIKVRFHRR